jgi:hypothetical protein
MMTFRMRIVMLNVPAALKVIFIAVPVVDLLYIMSNIIIMALRLIYYGQHQSNNHSSYPDGRKN